MNRIVVTRAMVGICHMQVCAAADATDDEILDECNRENPSGTTNGWADVIRNDSEHPNMNPKPCQEGPGRLHFLVAC